jgi:hypothetical protein
MSDDIERLLKHVPAAVPPPDPVLTSRLLERLLRSFPSRRSPSRRRSLLLAAAALLLVGTGFGGGRWTSPTHAAADLSVGVRPDTVVILEQMPVTLFGTVPSGRAGEAVAIDAKECGRGGLFYQFEGVRTEAQGVWSLSIPGDPSTGSGRWFARYIDTKMSFRARWNDRTSDTVTVNVRPKVTIAQMSAKQKRGKRQFALIVIAPRIKYRPKVIVERRAGDAWKPVAKRVVPLGGAFNSRAHAVLVWLRVSRGQTLRARLPAGEAAPCYLPAVSPNEVVG